MYRSLYPGDLFAEVDRLHREMQQALDTVSPSIRGFARGYPALNVGGTPKSVEVYAFAPGIDPASVQVSLERGVLTIEGERRPAEAPTRRADRDASKPAPTTTHIAERFHGRFRRVVSLPDDIDSEAVDASYRDGVLHISVPRRESAQPRRIDVQ